MVFYTRPGKCYNQVPVAEEDKAKTAFCTPFGLFEFERMPFSLCNAPGTFQRLMERIFGDQSLQSVLLYLDDVIVFSSSTEQHLQRLEMVLSRLQQKDLKAKLSKWHFFRKECSILDTMCPEREWQLIWRRSLLWRTGDGSGCHRGQIIPWFL